MSYLFIRCLKVFIFPFTFSQQGFLSLLKEKFSGGSRGGHPPSVEAAEQPPSLETSPSATPEMVRRRVEAGTQDNNEIKSSGSRRTSTPEIVRIRTTEAAAVGAAASTTQRFQITKNRQKLHPKNCEIDRSHLCLQQFDKFLICSACNHRKRK